MPEAVARFTVSIPPELLTSFDDVCTSKGYASRSEAIRDAIRDYLVAHQWASEEEGGQVVGTITLLHDHELRALTDGQVNSARSRNTRVLSGLQVHLDERTSLEVLVVQGAGPDVAALADELISRRGVKHGRLVCTAAGAGLP